ncbi:hypothetical protein MAPG_00082 [Magnaporthiopsis poae ATCC 64411]|uniref:Uncharacterized protein n=1 Tax=Magnaporthiopsis poae (strain ATCC 64411 / 73-15) TaxID=644358 RepID=A0A0C4DK19_MAGP6|nr:hypothetical protein MAPG_00082 [Magnaporthiopsis poae ATCC 64411]
MGFHEGLRLLLENGADANVVDKQLFTPLHHLVSNGKANQHASLNALARAGASLEARDSHGRTPLMLAAQLCRKTMVQWLLEMGADRLACLEDGSVAADLATDQGVKRMLGRRPNSHGGGYVAPVYH